MSTELVPFVKIDASSLTRYVTDRILQNIGFYNAMMYDTNLLLDQSNQSDMIQQNMCRALRDLLLMRGVEPRKGSFRLEPHLTPTDRENLAILFQQTIHRSQTPGPERNVLVPAEVRELFIEIHNTLNHYLPDLSGYCIEYLCDLQETIAKSTQSHSKNRVPPFEISWEGEPLQDPRSMAVPNPHTWIETILQEFGPEALRTANEVSP